MQAQLHRPEGGGAIKLMRTQWLCVTLREGSCDHELPIPRRFSNMTLFQPYFHQQILAFKTMTHRPRETIIPLLLKPCQIYHSL